jgi:hypothetical protein
MFMVSVQDQLVHGHWTVVRQNTVAAREQGRAKLLTSWKPGRGEREEGKRERERQTDRQKYTFQRSPSATHIVQLGATFQSFHHSIVNLWMDQLVD